MPAAAARMVILLGGVVAALTSFSIQAAQRGEVRGMRDEVQQRSALPIPRPSLPPALLLFTGEQRGLLEPCGCTQPQIGGLPRRATFLASLTGTRDEGRGMRDEGGLLVISSRPSVSKESHPPLTADSRPPTASADPSSLIPHPCVVVVDNGDLVEDPGRQSQLKAEALAGFYRLNGYAAVNLGERDYRLGFGYLRALQAMAKTPFLSANVRLGEHPAFAETTEAPGITLVGVLAGSLGAEVRRWNPMLQVEAPAVTLARLAPALKKGGRVVLLFHGAPEEARPIARRFPWLSAIVTAHEADDYRPEPLFAAGVPMVNAGRYGKVVGRLELGRGGVHLLPPVFLGPEWADSGPTRALMSRYLARVNAEGLLDRVPRLPDPEGRHFAGSAACRSCHAAAWDTWEKSAHSHAFAALVNAGHDRDPDCVTCHVVGLGAESGFRSESATPHLENVGCESCHGGGAAHAQAPTAHPMPSTAAAACARCHVVEQSPRFEFNSYWAKIRH